MVARKQLSPSDFKPGENVRDRQMPHLPGKVTEVGTDYVYVQLKNDFPIKYLAHELKYLYKI
jgi:hypothetical protein